MVKKHGVWSPHDMENTVAIFNAENLKPEVGRLLEAL